MIEIWLRQSVQGHLHPLMQKAQGKVAKLYHAKGRALYISSRADGEHQPGSFHYNMCAEDYLDGMKHVSKKEIKNKLGPDFDIVEYSWGYHVEYDPKGV